MINSKVRAVATVEFPEFKGEHVYMARNLVGHELKGVPSQYHSIVDKMLKAAKVPEHTGFYVTIDEQHLRKDAKLRRGGVHIDGNYVFGWGGNGWLNGVPGRMLTEDQHKIQYQSELGGILMASNFQACEGFVGSVDGVAGQGGDCGHLQDKLKGMESLWLKENVAYLGNSTFIHEGHVVSKDVSRQLIRLTLDTTYKYEDE